MAVGMIRRQVTQLTQLVDDLLDVARITQERIELSRCPLELVTVVAQAVEMVEPQLRERQHRLLVTAASGYEPVCVDGNFARLVQCVSNLLSNASSESRFLASMSADNMKPWLDAICSSCRNAAV